jgi:DNA-binding NarL/FixJ family response regulator
VVLIVDDHPVIALALRGLIEPASRRCGRCRRRACARPGDVPRRAALAATVLDLRLPDVAGLEASASCARCAPTCRSSSSPASTASRCAQRRARSGPRLVCKNENASMLLDSIGELLADAAAELCRLRLARRAARRSGRRCRRASSRCGSRSPRGCRTSRSPRRYRISLNTTKAHVRELLQRLGVRNRTEAATLYYRSRERRARALSRAGPAAGSRRAPR